MKAILYLFGACFLFSNGAISQTKEKQENKFEIWNIDSLQTVYIIYAKRNDSIIKIVSRKENFNNCKPILKGLFYQLEVQSLLKYSASKRHIGGVKYNGVLIKLEGEKVVWDLFTCDNLSGLCYLPQKSVACKRINKRTKMLLLLRITRPTSNPRTHRELLHFCSHFYKGDLFGRLH